MACWELLRCENKNGTYIVKMQKKLAYLIVAMAAIVLMYYYYNTTSEDFVAFNTDNVEWTPPQEINKDLKQVFKSLVEPGSQENVFDRPAGFKHVPIGKYEAESVVNDVLNRINQASGRNFKVIDQQSFKKEVNNGVNRYTSQIFIADKNIANDTAKNIEFVLTDSKLKYLGLLGDNIYDLDLVPGNEPYDYYYKHFGEQPLAEPWPTSESKVLFPPDVTDTLRKRKIAGRRKEKYACYDASGEIHEARSSLECREAQGVWDAPAEQNSDCPFYKANKNYDNEFGGVIHGGRCEMPKGVKRIGYRKFSGKPKCYNCTIGADGNPGTIGECCDEQEIPDYAFPSDSIKRRIDMATLNSKNLHWEAYPSRLNTKHVRRQQPQLEPVHNAFIGTSNV